MLSNIVNCIKIDFQALIKSVAGVFLESLKPMLIFMAKSEVMIGISEELI